MPFDENSKTEDVLSGVDLTGKTVIVTGGSSGLGVETARALTAHGANVTILGQSQDKLDNAAVQIKEKTGRRVETDVIALHKPASVRMFAENWLSHHDRLDILVNNAGIMAWPLTRTEEGWEMQFATNHLGHFLLTNLLLPALKAGKPARVVNLSSAGHHFDSVDLDDVNYENREYSDVLAYGQAKTANIWFSNEFDRRHSADGIRSFSVHPGAIFNTDLARNASHQAYGEVSARVEALGGYSGIPKSKSQGAATSCYAAASPELDGLGGKYLGDCTIREAGTDMNANAAMWSYSPNEEARLWEVSNTLLGTGF